jgi:peptidoglycan DL-endopeptidase CwlO
MNTQTKTLALVSTILLSASFAGPAKAATPKEPTPTTQELLAVGTQPITAAKTAVLPFEKPKIVATPASVPVVAPEPVAVQETAPVVEKPVVAVKAVTPVVASPKTASAKPVEIPAAPKVSASGKGASIAAAAYAQIGVSQDCTALVSNALAAVGINFHGWPNDYASLGTVVSTPAPGDILIYQDAGAGVPHVAIYVGNGQAIHGGFNGSTVLFSANVGSGYFAVRVA